MKKAILSALVCVFAVAFSASAQINWSAYAGKYEMTNVAKDGGKGGVPEITITQKGIADLDATGKIVYDGTLEMKVNVSTGEPATILTFVYSVAYNAMAKAVSGDSFILKADKESVKLEYKSDSVENPNETSEAMVPVFKESIGYMSGELKRELGDRNAKFTASQDEEGNFILTDADGVVWKITKL